MKPNQSPKHSESISFREMYKQNVQEVQLQDSQLANLLASIEAEEARQISAQTAAVEEAQANTETVSYSNSNTSQGWTCPSPADKSAHKAPVRQQRKRFWFDWSTEGRAAAVISGLVGAAAMMFVGIVAWSVVSTVLPSDLTGNSGQFAETTLPTEGMVALATADSDYANVYAALEWIADRQEAERQADQQRLEAAQRDSRRGLFDMSDDMATGDVMAESDAPLSMEAPSSGMETGGADSARMLSRSDAEPDFSDTNIQVLGVQEGDILKTDGRYIYALSAVALSVIEANNGSPRLLSTLDFRDIGDPAFRPGSSEVERRRGEQSPRGSSERMVFNHDYFKIYLDGERLIALRKDDSYRLRSVPGQASIGVDIFDVANPASPHFVTSFEINGDLVSSRMIGDTLYLVCTLKADVGWRSRDYAHPDTFVPSVRHGGRDHLVPASSIRIAPETRDMRAEYTHIIAIDTSRSGQIVSQAALLGGSDDLYMSTNNLFLLSEGQLRTADTKGSRGNVVNVVGNATTVTRVELSGGHIDIGNSRRLPGIVNNQFSLDEKDDVLRIITTFTRWEDWDSRGSTGRGGDWLGEEVVTEEWGWNDDFTDTTVWTLDDRLGIIGSIDGFGIDEDLYSARFMGDIVYFVTFREIDPVYAVDLSDPANPRFLSELKIPGFSEYLHPWTDGLLFGFGRDACEITGIRGGLKLSMFDISNPRDVTREHYLILDDYMRSDASSDHRAILVSPERNLIAFPADDAYLIYSYSERRGFEPVVKLPLISEGDNPARGLFIDNMFYVFELGDRPNVETFVLPSFRTWDFLWL